MQTRRQLRRKKIMPVLVGLAVAILMSGTAAAAADQLPADIDGGLGYLYEFAEPGTTAPFETARLAKLLAFVLAPRDEGVSMPGHSGAFLEPMAFHEFTVARSLPFMLGYAHNPGIPTQILTLGTLRCSYWKTFDTRHPDLPDVSARIANLESPFVIRGLEYEEIAPDPSSGAYYSYDLQRTLIGFRHGSNTVWLSLARQDDKSAVGRKGYALDPGNAWHFIYSGEEGITRTGLGWVDSFMYKGFSCIFYVQSDAAPNQVKVAVFKSLRAGWQGMNFVRYSHIRDGLERFGATMRQIIENPDLPPPARIEAIARRIEGLPIDQLRRINRDYLLALEHHYGQTRAFPRSWFEQEVVEGDFVSRLTRPQLEAVVFLEYMQGVLGMHPVTEPEILLSYLRRPEP
jgi:hypothetical protein